MISTIAIVTDKEGIGGIEQVAEEFGFKKWKPIAFDKNYSYNHQFTVSDRRGGVSTYSAIVHINVLNPERMFDADSPFQKYFTVGNLEKHKRLTELIGTKEIGFVMSIISGHTLRNLDRDIAKKLEEYYPRVVLVDRGIDKILYDSECRTR